MSLYHPDFFPCCKFRHFSDLNAIHFYTRGGTLREQFLLLIVSIFLCHVVNTYAFDLFSERFLLLVGFVNFVNFTDSFLHPIYDS